MVQLQVWWISQQQRTSVSTRDIIVIYIILLKRSFANPRPLAIKKGILVLVRGKSKLLVILGWIRWCCVPTEQDTILIILISLILFLIELVEPLTSTRKVPRVLCTQMCKLWRMNIKLIRVTVRRHVIWDNVHRSHLVLLFPLHPPILEPNFDLSFRQA